MTDKAIPIIKRGGIHGPGQQDNFMSLCEEYVLETRAKKDLCGRRRITEKCAEAK